MKTAKIIPLRKVVNPNVIRFIGIDGGIGNMGLSVVDYYVADERFVCVKFDVFNSTREAKLNRKPDRKRFPQRTLALAEADDKLREFMDLYNPHFVVMEDAFCNPALINAYTSLRLMIGHFSRLLYEEYDAPMGLVNNKTAKNIVIGSGSVTDKNDMISAILSHDRLKFKQRQFAKKNLVEHSADATAVVLAYVELNLDMILGAFQHEHVPVDGIKRVARLTPIRPIEVDAATAQTL